MSKSPSRPESSKPSPRRERSKASRGSGPAPGSPPSPWRQPPAWVICLVLGLGTLALYWPVLHFEFTRFDDDMYVTNNPWLHEGWSAIVRAFTTGYAANWHPLTWLSHKLDLAVFGMNAGGHHAVNVAFHIASTLLLFAVQRRMTTAFWPSAVVAALFAWHPLHVESVAWVAERKDVLSGFFWILTLAAYVRYAERPVAPRYALVLLSFVCGLLAKPMLVTLPFVLLLLDYWPLERWNRLTRPAGTQPRFPLRTTRQLLLEKLPLLPLVAGSSVVTYLVQQRGGAMDAAESFPLSLRLPNALVSYARYLGKTFWPADLAVIYPWRADGWPAAVVIGAILLLVGLTVAAFVFRKRHPYLAVGWLWFAGTLVPVIGLVQVGSQSMADRYTYLPHIGLFVACVWTAAATSAKWRWPQAVLAVGTGLILLGCIVATARQLPHWHDSLTLFEHTVAHTTDNPVAQLSLGMELQRQGRSQEAMPHLRDVLRVAPDLFLRHVRQGVGDDAEAHRHLAVLLMAMGQFAEATTHCQQSLALNPTNAETHLLFGRVLVAQNRPNDALAEYTEAVRLAPTNIDAQLTLALTLDARRRDAEALPHYRAVLEARPGQLEALNNTAWILATHPMSEVRNGTKAVELAARACELSAHTNAIFEGTLAAAYAETGQFAEAVATAQAAADQARQVRQPGLEATLRKHAQLYQSRQPFREGP